MEATATLHSFEESYQEEKKNTCLFSNLPNDVGLQCLARVPRSCYRSLSRVCKLWQYHISSQALYSTRKALNIIDFSVCLFISGESRRWLNGSSYQLDRFIKIHELFPLSSSTSNSMDLFQIPSPPSIPPKGAAIVSVGYKIYAIGGISFGRTMWVYDLVSDKWELAKPQMQVARTAATAVVVNDKIYVMGGLSDSSEDLPSNWAEVFDVETNKWSSMPSPTQYEVSEKMLYRRNAVAEGKIMLFDQMIGSGLVMVFDTGSGEWSQMQTTLDEITDRCLVVINGVLYFIRWHGGKILGYDFDVHEVKMVRGMEGVFPEKFRVHRLVNMGGRLVVLWFTHHFENNLFDEWTLYATVIKVQKDKDGKLWGSALSTALVGKLPGEYSLKFQDCPIRKIKFQDCVVVGL